MILIAEECRDYLVTTGRVRKPSSTSGSLPKCFIEAPGGAPSVEETGGNLVHIRYAGGVPSPSFGEFVDQIDLDFAIRTSDLRTALELGFNISNDLDGKRAFQMDTLRVEQVLRTRPFDRLYESSPGQGYTLIGQFRFMVRKSSQA